ncbi:MAG: Ig-like domain-containing protein [Cyclobacteriaceae bacterium]|nr:Ig-like domain-containing protein [Cyclobacteriaceae bacterium]
MKTLKWMLSTLVATGMMVTVFMGCSDDEPPALTLVSLTADDIDLNAATSATGVPVGASITATFNVAVDAASASAAITLVRQFDGVNVPVAVTVNGAEVTINPNSDFSTGTLFILTISNAIKSTENKTLSASIERNFTSEGTFAVPGAFAHWTFEDNAIDIISGRAPKTNGTVAITYVAGRKADAGKAASFNGTTSIIEFANGDQLMNNGSWTMSVWVRTNSTLEKGQFVMGLGAFYGFQFEISGGYNNYKLAASYAHTNPAGAGKFSEDLWVDGTGNLGWQGWTFSKDFGAATMSPVIKDVWAHYVFVYNATTRTGTAYLNGEKVKEQDFDNWPDDSNPRFTTGLSYRGAEPDVVNELALGFIHSRAGTMWDSEPWGGYDFPGANHFHGLMDDLIFYHKALTLAEVTAMYNSGKP